SRIPSSGPAALYGADARAVGDDRVLEHRHDAVADGVALAVLVRQPVRALDHDVPADPGVLVDDGLLNARAPAHADRDGLFHDLVLVEVGPHQDRVRHLRPRLQDRAQSDDAGREAAGADVAAPGDDAVLEG